MRGELQTVGPATGADFLRRGSGKRFNERRTSERERELSWHAAAAEGIVLEQKDLFVCLFVFKGDLRSFRAPPADRAEWTEAPGTGTDCAGPPRDESSAQGRAVRASGC